MLVSIVPEFYSTYSNEFKINPVILVSHIDKKRPLKKYLKELSKYVKIEDDFNEIIKNADKSVVKLSFKIKINSTLDNPKEFFKEVENIISIVEKFEKENNYNYLSKFENYYEALSYQFKLYHEEYENDEFVKKIIDYLEKEKNIIIREETKERVLKNRIKLLAFIEKINSLFLNEEKSDNFFNDFKRILKKYNIEIDDDEIKKEVERIETFCWL